MNRTAHVAVSSRGTVATWLRSAVFPGGALAVQQRLASSTAAGGSSSASAAEQASKADESVADARAAEIQEAVHAKWNDEVKDAEAFASVQLPASGRTAGAAREGSVAARYGLGDMDHEFMRLVQSTLKKKQHRILQL